MPVPPVPDEALDRDLTGDEDHVVIDLRDRAPSRPVHHRHPRRPESREEAFATDWALDGADS